jgi:hypothetical protein
MNPHEARERLQRAVKDRKRAERYAEANPWSNHGKTELVRTQRQEWFWRQRVLEMEGQQLLPL